LEPADARPEKLFMIYGSDGEPTAYKHCLVCEKPFGDRPIDRGIRILARLEGWHWWEVAQLVNDLVLKELAGLIGGGADTSRNIDAPPFETGMAVLRPTECNEIEAQCIGHGGIIFGASSICWRESVERKPRGEC